MGYYIETDSNRNKADYILRNYDSIEIDRPIYFEEIAEDMALIVVVDNGAFEAAAFAYSENEFKAFTLSNDPRPRRFVLMDRKKACELTGYKG